MDQKLGPFRMITAGYTQFLPKNFLHFAPMPDIECLFPKSISQQQRNRLISYFTFAITKFNFRKLNANIMPYMQILTFFQLENNCSSMSTEIFVSFNRINSSTDHGRLHFLKSKVNNQIFHRIHSHCPI